MGLGDGAAVRRGDQDGQTFVRLCQRVIYQAKGTALVNKAQCIGPQHAFTYVDLLFSVCTVQYSWRSSTQNVRSFMYHSQPVQEFRESSQWVAFQMNSLPMGCSMDAHRLFAIAHGLAMGFPWHAHGCPWVACGSPMRCACIVHVLLMGYPYGTDDPWVGGRGPYGSPMSCRMVANGMVVLLITQELPTWVAHGLLIMRTP